MLSRLFSTSSSGIPNDVQQSSISYQPMPRWGHSVAAINNKLYVWGGCMEILPKVHSSLEKTSLLSQIEVFDPRSLLWEKKNTTGNPPLGVYWNAYASNDKNMYTFGGYCGHGKCYHNSVHQLDVFALQWREVMATNPGDSPMKKWQCGMVAYEQGGDNMLCIFGGWGVLSSNHKNMKHEFIADRANLGCVWSNELHLFNLSKGIWECPSTTGTQPPPCQGFTFTQVDSGRVILFGGFQPTTRRRINDVYILNLQTKHWIRLYNHMDPTIPWPSGRDDHSACVKDGTSPLLLSIGGVNNQFNTIGDMWIMDIDSGRWKQVSAPQAVVGRRGHSTMVFSLGPRHFLLVIYGGISEWLVDKSHRDQPMITETSVVELYESDGGSWSVLCEQTDSVPSTPLLTPIHGKFFSENSIQYSPTNSYHERKNSKRNRGGSSIHTMTLDRRSALQKQLEESRKEAKILQGQLAEANNALKKSKKQTVDIEKKKSQLETNFEGLKKEFERIQLDLEAAEQKIEAAEKTISSQAQEIQGLKSKNTPTPSIDRESPVGGVVTAQTDDSLWVISKDEIVLTQAELSRDNWSSVYVASFRGLHVAARCFKEELLTEDNSFVYSKKIKIALKARHPNIMQLIGATVGPVPIILSELMPTTLKMTLRQGPLNKRQVLSVASDIAGALNYLHQWIPDPIIHRNVNTTSILLEPMGNNTWKAKLSDCGTSNFINFLNINFSPNRQQSIFAAPESKAPELYSPKTDVYSFGVVLLEMCQPAEGIAPTNDLRPRLQRLTWPTMASLVRACTSGAPADRISMNDVIKRLSSGVNGGVANNESLV